MLHPQESLICALLAVRANSQTGKLCESVTLKVPSNGGALNFNTNPYQPLIKEFQKTSSETTLAVSWTVCRLFWNGKFDSNKNYLSCLILQATQASDDGNGTLVIEGQQYISCGVQETRYIFIFNTWHFMCFSLLVFPIVLHPTCWKVFWNLLNSW